MSQRSHIAQRGSNAIRECSAAWSEPSRRRSESRFLGHPRLRDEPDRLGLELGLREVELDEIERGLIVDRFLLVRDHCSLTTTLPKASSSPSRHSVRRAWSIEVIVSFFACV